MEWIDHSIASNRRTDGLYHAYNIVRFENRRIFIRRLYPMLEGQVAILSSTYLSPEESLSVLTALRRSEMYRADQHSYLLYPDRELPHFTEKNNLSPKVLRRSALLRKLLADRNERLIERDVSGKIHFNPDIRNAQDVARILDELPSRYGHLRKRERSIVLEIFEHLFDHESFTGRSGTFFGYEGLGCIYWHMVSKLLLAAQECYLRAAEQGTRTPGHILKRLAKCYHDIRRGIGDCKTPQEYGAFPTDPYSHTPAHAGARQPGLTGQVKEDVLCRFGELGVMVANAQIHFAPRLLQQEEFLRIPQDFRCFDISGTHRRVRLPGSSLAFTYCQTLIIYQLGRRNSLTVMFRDGTKRQSEDLALDAQTSSLIFDRAGKIDRIIVCLGDINSA